MTRTEELLQSLEKPLTDLWAWTATRDRHTGYTDDELTEQVEKTKRAILQACKDAGLVFHLRGTDTPNNTTLYTQSWTEDIKL